MAYNKYAELINQDFILDYSLSRIDNLGYNCFTYKILNTLVTFRSAYPLERLQSVHVQNVLELHDSIVIELVPSNIDATHVLSVISYKVPLSSDYQIAIHQVKALQMIYSVVDTDGANSKIGFIVMLEKERTGEIDVIIEENYITKFTLLGKTK